MKDHDNDEKDDKEDIEEEAGVDKDDADLEADKTKMQNGFHPRHAPRW